MHKKQIRTVWIFKWHDEIYKQYAGLLYRPVNHNWYRCVWKRGKTVKKRLNQNKKVGGKHYLWRLRQLGYDFF